MRVGYSYWGLCADFETQATLHQDTADGSRFNRHVLVHALLSRGHTVVALQEVNTFPEIDMLFLEWRWPTYKNSGENPRDSDLRRQELLLEAYHGCVPIVALDNDFKLTAKDEERWPQMVVAEPALSPRRLLRKRERLMPWTDWKELLPARDPLPMYGYIGNNYERPEEFRAYYFEPAKALRRDGVQTSLLGNWLQRSPERGAPEWLIANTEVAFLPRCNFNGAMRVLNACICTTHVSKPEYYKNQLVPPRYFEAISVNCPALTPTAAFSLGARTIVTSSEDVKRAVAHLKTLNTGARVELCAQQREVLRSTKLFDVETVVQFLEVQCA